MPDRLYLSCWLLNREKRNLLKHFGKMLDLFPFSKLSKRPLGLRVYAVDHTEPPLMEREFPIGTEVSAILAAAAEFLQEDCSAEVDAFWDLWQFDLEWKLQPVPVTLECFGPDFDNELGDDLRIEFGPEDSFLPQLNVEGRLRMVQSNVRSLLHLVGELERGLPLERRQLWSESGANFAEVLANALGARVPGNVLDFPDKVQ